MKNRTEKENAYYWGTVLRMLSVYFKEEPLQIHRRIKRHYNIRSTTILATIQFERLMNKLRVWSNKDLNMIIPLPKEEIEFDIPSKKRKFSNNFNLGLLFEL